MRFIFHSEGCFDVMYTMIALEVGDFDDLQFAIAGLDVGRQRRHLHEGSADNAVSEQKKSERAALTALQLILLNDPEYAALRARVENTLAEVDTRLAELHLEAEALLAESATKLAALEVRASELPDGTKVFRSANGEDVFTADERVLLSFLAFGTLLELPSICSDQ